ncbi:MAG TPA: alpha/beta fold hydrolase [Motilibacterales bacterium]|nr:alpha/beta fold hydrolase [Motilibacterales bacterium]
MTSPGSADRPRPPAPHDQPEQVVGSAAAALFLVAGAVVLLASSGDVARSSTVAGATPIRVVAPEGGVRSPAIVLAHGFSGSAAMMDPMASALARAGHVVVMPDLPGHGGNAAPLEDAVLEPAVGDAVTAAAELTGLPVAVVGHSMGAGAVTSWAVDNRAEATVGISLPSAEDLPEDPARPRNLLVLWGSVEQARFSEAALAALHAGYPDAQPGQTYGDPEQGTARRAVEIAGAEHISVIYRQQSYEEVAAWLGAGDPRGDARMVGVLLVLVGGVLAARPLLALAGGPGQPGRGAGGSEGTAPLGSDGSEATAPLGSGGSGRLGSGGSGGSEGTAPLGVGWSLAVLSGAAVIAGLGAAALQPLTDRVPVAVTGYLLGWFAVGTLILGMVTQRRRALRGTLRGLGWGALAGSVLALAMAMPARLTWAAYALVGPRPWVFGVLVVVLGAWFWAESRLIDGTWGWRRAVVLVSSRLLVVVGLLAAVALLGAPGFLTLTVPLVVPILLVLAILGGWARDPAAAAAAQSIPLALVMATTFPLIG